MELTNEDLCAMFHRDDGFERSPHDAFVARCREVVGAVPMTLSFSEAIAVYGVKLAGLEAMFVEWQTCGGYSRRSCSGWEENGAPEPVANLDFGELTSAMKCDGYIDTFAKAAAYCSALKARIR